ncbi:hypothetical protein GYMLUDRAFT_239308 [Collybiopsis luxurians FD-317 M1]|nr:hypothetical protein GYMLUDRAFT_239308 [Collybiopsis luxurians FD-317 M1]
MFNPQSPASCPFVTAGDATQVNPNSTVLNPESACEQVIFSGGGFPNIFSMPDYQKSAVASFLTNHPPPYPSAQFNTSGVRPLLALPILNYLVTHIDNGQSRAYPDLAANGANYVESTGNSRSFLGHSVPHPS